LKILEVITSLAPGGAEIMLSSLCREFKQRGHEVKVVSLRPLPEKSFVLDALAENEIPVTSLNVTKLTPWRFLHLRSIIREFTPDIIHSHLFHANITSRLALPKASRIPLVNTVHTMELRPHRQWYFTLDRLTCGRCDVQTAVSQSARDFHADRIKVPPESMPVVYNGIRIPPKVTPESRRIIRAEWGLDEADMVIGSVGRFCHEKGYDILLKLLPRLGELLPADKKMGVVLIGDGEERSRFEALAAAAPDNIDVVMPGMLPGAPGLCGAFDLFVMPSRLEGFGLALAEAMTHGIPVLVNNIPPLVELLDYYDSGKAVDFISGSEDELCRDIIAMAGQKLVSPPTLPFTTDKMIEGYLRIFNQLT
jgi:glycosyltransferase involved in cell wall biosynthesis